MLHACHVRWQSWMPCAWSACNFKAQQGACQCGQRLPTDHPGLVAPAAMGLVATLAELALPVAGLVVPAIGPMVPAAAARPDGSCAAAPLEGACPRLSVRGGAAALRCLRCHQHNHRHHHRHQRLQRSNQQRRGSRLPLLPRSFKICSSKSSNRINGRKCKNCSNSSFFPAQVRRRARC